MKFTFFLLIILSSMSSTFAERVTCANLDYSATAEISENYIGMVLLRRLHKVKVNDNVVYRNVFGKIDKSESFESNGYVIDMFSGGLTVHGNSNILKLVCGAPEYYIPNSNEHDEFVEYWYYIFK